MATTKSKSSKPKAEEAKSNGKADARAAQKEKERVAEIKSGELIEVDGAEFRLVTERAKATVDQRTAKVVELLRHRIPRCSRRRFTRSWEVPTRCSSRSTRLCSRSGW